MANRYGDSVHRKKTAIIWTLKHDGDIEDPGGRATFELHERLTRRGVDMERQYVNKYSVTLVNEGLIERDSDPIKKKAYRIRLISTGNYEDPFGEPHVRPMEFPNYTEAIAAPTDRPVEAPKKRNIKLDKLVTEIERLPLPEKLMLAGMIVDGCAGEVDETYQRLRTILGTI